MALARFTIFMAYGTGSEKYRLPHAGGFGGMRSRQFLRGEQSVTMAAWRISINLALRYAAC